VFRIQCSGGRIQGLGGRAQYPVLMELIVSELRRIYPYLNVYKRKYAYKLRLSIAVGLMFVGNQTIHMSAPHFITWLAFQKAEILADKIFVLSKQFPPEERFSLTDQIRRASRSVCANQAESYAKRRYPKHFISKLTDAQGENYETMTWLRFARRSKYINDIEYTNHYNDTIEVEKSLSYMLKHEDKFRGEFSK